MTAKMYGPIKREVAQTIRSALAQYEAETQRYLYGEQREEPEPDRECCDRCRSEWARWQTRQEAWRLLNERRQRVSDALSFFGPSLEARDGSD